MVANSLCFGVKAGLMTVAGTSAAIIGQLTVAALGGTAIFGALDGAPESAQAQPDPPPAC